MRWLEDRWSKRNRDIQLQTGMVDFHSHILPGVDDGAQNMEEALTLLQMEYEQGVRIILLTPHFRREYFETPRQKIKAIFRTLQENLENSGLDLKLYLGCEFYRRSDMVSLLKEEPAYRIAGGQSVLTEFSPGDTFALIRGCITELLMAGYRPVIAHAERYFALRDVSNIQYLVDSGAYIQVNAGSVTGEEGFQVRQYCGKLLQKNLIHLIGSDAHDPVRRKPYMGRCAGLLIKKYGVQQAERILCVNPAKLIANEYL